MARPLGHGKRRTPEYEAWAHMKYRYRRQVVSRWHEFENFLQDVGKRPRRGYRLTRLNKEKPFKKGNVKWK